MGKAFGPEIDWKKTKGIVDKTVQNLRPWRDQIAKMIRQYAGPEISDLYNDMALSGRVTNPKTINPMSVLIETYMQNLVSGRPRARVSTPDVSLRFQQRTFQLALNRIIECIHLEKALERGVLDALFGLGIVKVGIALNDPDLYGSQWRYSALPYAEAVHLADYVWDTDAADPSRIRWEGNVYDQPLGDIELDERNDPDVVRKLDMTKGVLTDYGQLGDPLTQAYRNVPGTDSDMVELVDIYLPRERMIATFPLHGTEPLRVQNFIGPPDGPYHKLLFHPVPGRARGLSPAEIAAPLADLMSLLFADMGAQASREKRLLLVTGPGEIDAQRINQASDGEAVPVADPSSCQERSFGGVDPKTVQFTEVCRSYFSWENGNLDTAGGLAAGAQTLGQEQMLKQTSSARMTRMQGKVEEWTRGIMKALAWYCWNDPECRIKTIDRVQNTDVEIPLTFPVMDMMDGTTQDIRRGTRFESFEFDIQPFSLVPQPPSVKMQQIRGIIAELMPIAPLLQQQGTMIDFTAYVKQIADLGDLQELLEVVRAAPPDPASTRGPTFDRPPKPANTTRVYERVRGGGPTPDGAARATAMGMSDDTEDTDA